MGNCVTGATVDAVTTTVEDLDTALKRRAPLAEVQAIVRAELERQHGQGAADFCEGNRRNAASAPDVVAFLASKWPGALLERDDGIHTFPFHDAIMMKEVEVVEALVALGGTEPLRQPDQRRQLPLHVAARRGLIAMVKVVSEAWPEALQIQGFRGRLPLHDAVDDFRPHERLQVVQFLAGAYPRALRIADDDGRRPLHCAIIRLIKGSAEDNQVVDYLVARSPRALMVPDNEGLLPLHLAAACFHSVNSLPILRLLVEAGPAALHVRARQGRSALHIAVSTATSCLRITGWEAEEEDSRGFSHLIELLVTHSSRELMLADDQGRLPIHVAVERPNQNFSIWINNISLRWIRLLADECSEALCVQDRLGRTPLHLAASCPGSHAFWAVQILADRLPEALDRQDAHGRTPLHIMLARPTEGWEGIRSLMDLRLEALRVPDERGKLPLHIAVSVPVWCPYREVDCSFAKLRVVEHIVTQWEGATRVRDGSGRLPVHEAMLSGASLDVVYLLLRVFPPALRPRGDWPDDDRDL